MFDYGGFEAFCRDYLGDFPVGLVHYQPLLWVDLQDQGPPHVRWLTGFMAEYQIDGFSRAQTPQERLHFCNR
jgi:hypothetical protein